MLLDCHRSPKVCPVTAISQELVQFETQVIQNPEVSGIEDPRGELYGFEVKEYLLTKCAHQMGQKMRLASPVFLRVIPPSSKFFIGFTTGDIVKAEIHKGKYAGKYTGRIAIRFRLSVMLLLPDQCFDVHPKSLTTIHRVDGYEYTI